MKLKPIEDMQYHPVSEKLVEIHFRGGRPVAVGDQFGVGRVMDPAVSP